MKVLDEISHKHSNVYHDLRKRNRAYNIKLRVKIIWESCGMSHFGEPHGNFCVVD